VETTTLGLIKGIYHWVDK